MEKDIFCKIIAGEIPAKAIYRDDDFIVLNDINPQAPTHLLVIPVAHYGCLEDFKKKDAELLGRAFMLADKAAHDAGLNEGYRLIVNEGDHGGKVVPHLHIHVLGGRHLGPKLVKQSE